MKWEYDVIAARALDDVNSLKQKLNQLGKEGWELVASISTPDKLGAGLLMLKRPQTSD
jgi:16S rRNA G527 N7-methylase RsmG